MKISDLIIEENIINEASLGRIYHHIQNREIGILSACRGKYKISENNKRTNQLKSDIVAAHFGFMNITGSYIEDAGTPKENKVTERSFFVIGNGQKNALL